MKNMGNRNTSMDVIRIAACYLVCSVHFFLNTTYYSYPIDTPKMFFYTVLRTGCMICVPLFLVLTGYLMNGKKASLSYYWGLEKTLLTYLLASIACMCYKKFVINWTVHANDILSFTGAPYAWYVEMYIGLFLLIPFLNLIWQGLTTKRQKQGLMISLLILTALPSIINIFNFDSALWWSLPATSAEYVKILPAWWKAFYPITYYFTGAYLREFPSKFKKPHLFLLILISVAAFGIFNCYRSYGSKFVWGIWQDWGALPILINTVLVFRFISSFDMNRLPNGVRWLLAKISDLCLGTYLLSWIPDNNIYAYLNQTFPNVPDKMKYFFVVPLLVFSIATVFSLVIHLIGMLIHKVLPIKQWIANREARKAAAAGTAT